MTKKHKRKINISHKRKKSKKIHSGFNKKNNRTIMTDNGSLWHKRYIIEANEENCPIEINFYKLFSDACANYDIKKIEDIEDKNKFIEIILEYIELKMAETAKRYSCHELLYWSRRIAPINAYKRKDLMSICLYRETLNLIIAKYGTLENKFKVLNTPLGSIWQPEYINNLNAIIKPLVPIPKEVCETLKDVYYLESLCNYYIYITQAYRILNKGGELIDDKKLGLTVNTDKNISYLIDLYDRRLKYANILSEAGTFIQYNKSKNKFFTVAYILNADLEESIRLTDHKKTKNNKTNKYKSNYLIQKLELDAYYRYLNMFEEEFLKYYGFSVVEFMVFITCISMNNLQQFSNLGRQYELYQRAYILTENMNNIVNEVLSLYEHKFKDSFPEISGNLREHSDRILEFLSCKAKIPRDINLWTRGPRKIFYPLGGEIAIIDYSGIIPILETIILPLSRQGGKTGNNKSIHFEKQTNEMVKNIFGEHNFWLGSKEIKAKNGTREIDSSFFLNEYLFLLECKSVNVSFAFDMGDAKAINYRKNKMLKFIDEVNDKANFIKKNKDDLSIRIPKNIKYIVPVLVTPFPEYIWADDKNLFLSRNLPRILTLNELSEIKKINNETKLKNLPFVVHL